MAPCMTPVSLCSTSYTASRPALLTARGFTTSTRYTSAYRRYSTANASKRTYEPDPLLDQPCPVPREQQPMQEFVQLKDTFLFDWAALPLPEFVLRLVGVWGGFLLTLGLPVSVLTFDLTKQPVECLVAASTGSLVLVTVLVLRLYLGYKHVGGRLLSATVEYEETGWYDGQVWVKTPQMLMRDRLLGIYTVKPALQRLQYSLYSLTGAFVLSMAFLSLSAPSDAQQLAPYDPSADAGTNTRDYWDAVREYEPWALEGGSEPDTDEGLAAAQKWHMLGSGEGFRY